MTIRPIPGSRGYTAAIVVAQMLAQTGAFALPALLPTYMDRDLLQYDVIWAAAGTPKAVFRTEPARLREATQAIVIDVK